MAEEPEPLAFRVRPRFDECFDSWMDRLTRRHDISRKNLYEHLKIDTALANIDLAVARRIPPARLNPLVERLAWSTSMPESAVLRTFVACSRFDLLPPALRTFGCAECWLEWHRERVPLRIVRRQNIWRSSRRRLAECGPRLGVDVKRRACGVASADTRWSAA